MALDTTIGGAAADSYTSLADFQTYATNAGWTLTATDAVQETYLRRAEQYLARTYEWIGDKKTNTQALDWPRYTDKTIDGWAISSDTIPQKIKDAQSELAWLIHEGATPFASVDKGAVRVEKSKAGPVSVETQYSPRETPRYVAIEGLIRDYIEGGPGSVRMVRG